mmetsp:Transcript_22191/g.27258  ORF Transcript_22191/g.27258 Transcript_22191/m.27258 type:complete len:86 (+) Transcript_22191:189-446(+)
MLAILQFTFACLIKVSKYKQAVNIFDMCFFSSMLSITFSVGYSLVTKKGFSVPKNLRSALITRSIVGIMGLLCFMLAATLVPITI